MQQKKLFTKGMDSDTAAELMENGRDRFRLNVRVLTSENGNLGAIETMNGNTLITTSLPPGANVVVGSEEDELRRKNYYFVHHTPVGADDPTLHSVFEYDQQSKVITLVLQNEFLAFSLDHLITGIDIVELTPTDHLLYWSDNNVQPRKINIEKAILHTAGDFENGYKTPFDPSIINRIKNPPDCGPTYTWGSFTPTQPNEIVVDAELRQFSVIKSTDAPASAFATFNEKLTSGSILANNKDIIIQDGGVYDIEVSFTHRGVKNSTGLSNTTGPKIHYDFKLNGVDVPSKVFDIPNFLPITGPNLVVTKTYSDVALSAGDVVNFRMHVEFRTDTGLRRQTAQFAY